VLVSSLHRDTLNRRVEDQASPRKKKYSISKITNAKRDGGFAHMVEEFSGIFHYCQKNQ
jgi:hypothetical protein